MRDPARNAVFLSYAREDIEAARRIAEALRSQGVEVWFDQNELRGGDAWDQRIRKQIRECALFLPVISHCTHARNEGYFRLEWKLAVERTHLMRDGVPFIVPTVVDEAREDPSAVPEAFLGVHWTRLVSGLPTPEFVAQIKYLLAPSAVAVNVSERQSDHPLAGARSHTSNRSPPSDGESVAVLPFANMSRDPENEYFSDGISEELLNVLAKLPGLRVSARTSSFFFKGRNVPVPEIARTLGVDYVVEGSVRKAGTRVRITAQLINAQTGFHLWSDTYDRELKDIFELQDEIARAIAQNLQVKLVKRTKVMKTVNPEAHRLVLEGRHFWNLRTEQGFRRGEAAFQHALAIDPDFAEAHSGLAEVCIVRATYRQWDGFTDTADDVERARAEAKRALELDPSLTDPCAVRGLIHIFDRNLAASEEQFAKALAVTPNSALVHSWHGISLSRQGRLDAAIARYQKAAELNPLWFTNLALYASHLAHARRYEEALEVNARPEELRTGIAMLSRSIQPQILLGLGRMDEAVAAARFITANPELEPRWLADSNAVRVLRAAGFESEARDHAARVFARWPAESFNRGFVLGALGRIEEALPFLARSPYMPSASLFWDTLWDPWREDPRFQEMIARQGSAREYEVARDALRRM